MAVKGYQNIVSDGIVFYVDAANRKSYLGSGVDWDDLSGNEYNGTLINGPTFDSGNSGSLVFDGLDEYISCGNENNLQITEGSVCCWIKTSAPGSGFRSIITKQWNYGLFTSNNNTLITYDWSATAVRSTGINIADGEWKYIVLTFTENTGSPSNNAIVYLNGESVLTTTIKLNTTYIVELQIGNGGTISGGANQHINANISQAKIYNRVLTPEEVLQNYNATKWRFQ
jgi:hypothetical protein